MFIGVDHVGVAVKNLDEAINVYRDIFGFRLLAVHVLPERGVRVALFATGGETHIELLEPLGRDSSVVKFLENRGEGIHHIAVKVDNIEKVLEELKMKGVVLVDEKPRIGVEGKKIAFIHPKSTKGVLLELVME
ncbi:MAG: methylmalonyl-CoA epimerase [Candidatus Bathyarchaeia archaeon]